MSLTPHELELLRETAKAYTERVAELAQRICAIPAPTGDEHERASFVADLLRERNYAPEMDEIGNVYARRGKHGKGPLLMLLAHTDTVFPITTPIIIERDGDIMRGPGIGDNSVNVAAMLATLDILDELGLETAADLMVVADVGEEGLGNLRGARKAVERYREDLGAVIAVDGNLGRVTHMAVGSKRWRITVRGPGGHSFGAFGTPSAIHGLARIIAGISEIVVPQEPRTTYNIGMIEGGTSINTIAASASALLDMRSMDITLLDRLAQQVHQIIERAPGKGLTAEIEILGERPAGKRDRSDPLVQLAGRVLTWLGHEPVYSASSTDANIPIYLNIPAICVGITRVRRAHTTDEWLAVPPIGDGLAQLTRLCIEASTLITV